MNKIFMVTLRDGTPAAAEQLATLAFCIENVQHRFVVTRLPNQTQVSVTHRHSGKSVATVDQTLILATLGDYGAAAKTTLSRLIEKHGEARVASVLRAAEV